MRIFDIIKLSAHHICCGGLKTLLCIIAVFTGVFSFCVACYAGEYAEESIGGELEKLGIRGITFYSKEQTLLQEKEIEDISNVSGVKDVMPLSVLIGSSELNNCERTTLTVFVDESLESVWNVELLYGRSFNDEDIRHKRNVAVIDSEYAELVYKRKNIVGKTVKVKIDGYYEDFEIIGVVSSQKKGIQTLVGATVPEIVYIPYVKTSGVDMVAITCFDEYDYEEVSTRVQNKIKEETGVNMQFKNLDVYMESFRNVLNTVSLLAAAFASISLIVGGIGVMSNMLNKAEQRKYEIGVYLSLGASQKDVCLMFLFESVLICLIGGAIGWILSSFAYDIFTDIMGSTSSINVRVGLYGITAASVCGMVFGLFPAIKAAVMKPINAIRG